VVSMELRYAGGGRREGGRREGGETGEGFDLFRRHPT
jgi:hypothetical protein